MKKLRLHVDELRIERFESLPRDMAAKGTVVGQDAMLTEYPRCQPSGGSCDTGIPVCSYC